MGIVKELLAHTPILALPIGALLLFIVVFVVVVARTMMRKPATYADVERLAVDDDAAESEHLEDAHGHA